jgi:hypothetical protein
MRPLQIKASRIAALTVALLVLLPTAPAVASEAGNPFAPASPAAPSAAKQAGGAGKAASTSPTSTPGAGKTGARSAGVGKVSTATTPKGAIVPSQVTTAKTTTTASTSTQEASSGTNTSEILALIAGGALLVGIAYMILRDARSVAPVTEGLATGGTRNPEGRLRKRRAQAKAARLQRKRHRKR